MGQKEYVNKGAAVTHTITSDFPVTIIDIEECAHTTAQAAIYVDS